LISQLQDSLKKYIDRLLLFSQPHMRGWTNERRRNRKRTTIGAAQKQQENEEEEEEGEMEAGGTPSMLLAKQQQQQTGTDRGFIQSEWALIFMLRMGLMGVQMMGQTGRSLANIG
jgi:hypothetical protein